jgi:hypothetical protein
MAQFLIHCKRAAFTSFQIRFLDPLPNYSDFSFLVSLLSMVCYRAARAVHQALWVRVRDDQSLGLAIVDPLYEFSIYPLVPKPIATADQRIHLPNALVEMAMKISEDTPRVLVHLVEGIRDDRELSAAIFSL